MEHGEKPYLITSAKELAFLAQEVNNGNSYEGKVFQLTKDINLNNKEWTPIGNAGNSFKGIFNGSGRMIQNATITISGTLTTNQIYSYGFFGSIGNGSSYAIIKNVQFNNINLNLTVSGTTSNSTTTANGYNLGIVTGTMYNKSKVANVSVKNSKIQSTNNISVQSRIFQVFAGGIAGNVQNSNGNYNDPGDGSRYKIENCYVSADIDMSSIVSNSNRRMYYLTLVQSGGIVGNIRKQPVWPEKCLYSGAIDCNGFIGPIFGGLIQTESSSNNVNNFATYWNGNQAGGNLTMTSYYTNFTANGQSFSRTEETGTSSSYINSTITTRNIDGVKGVNKGIYTSNISTLEDTLNNNGEDVVWLYENGDLNLIPRLTTSVTQTDLVKYEAQIEDRYNIGTYTYEWYINGTIDENNQTNIYQSEPNFVEDREITLIANDGSYFSIQKFVIEKLTIEIEFDVNETSNSVTASLVGTARDYINLSDYTFRWYRENIAGDVEELEGQNSLSLENLEEGYDYKLVATNNRIEQLSAENSFTFGDRIVVFVDPSNGNNNNDGFTPNTAVRSMTTGYSKLSSQGSVNTNIIVLMGSYTTQDIYYNTKDSTNSNYQKNVTVTGKYKEYDYSDSASLTLHYVTEGFLWFRYTYYNFINGDTTFQYLTFNGEGSQAYLYAQGYNLTMGKGLHMTNYSNANTNQGLITGSAPAFHVLGGYLQYNRTTLPRNNGKIVIKSGAYGRVLGGGGSGDANGTGQTTSHDFTGSNLTNDTYTATVEVNIEESTKGSYTYDINLLVGGATAGNMYANININVENGSIGRLLGGSIGDRTYISNWNYPENTFLGFTTINLNGGTIQELYGGSLGRNMDALQGSGTAANLTCDIYFYGTININISGSAVVNANIYGAGAGGVTGYSENSSDTYKSYGRDIDSCVNINISGGTINGNVYGGGYGYTEYLTENVTAIDGGALYGDSNIAISGGTINGNVYGAGCGYDDYSNKTDLAQQEGTSNIEISGMPTITGQVFGAGQGVAGRDNMAKLTGNSNVIINTDLSTEVYGGGNISQTVGKTNIDIKSGTHTADIYGGGNVGIVNGDTNVDINGGSQTRVFGGGNQASVTNSVVNVNAGTTNEIYAGGNAASVDTTKVYLKGGEATTIYGGSNQTGTVQTSNIETTSGNAETIYGGNNVGGTTDNANVTINGGSITSAVYGGGNQVDTTKTIVTLQSSDNTIPNIFGGGNQAGVTDTYVYCNGASSTNVFGGSNTNGTVNTSNVETNNGVFENVYGGNNQGGTTVTTNVTINGGSTGNVYGGGDQATSSTSNISTTGGTVNNIYGGGNQAGVTTTNVTTNGGSIGSVFGGANMSGDVEESNVTTNDSTTTNKSSGLTMEVTATAEETTWQSTAYPTVGTIKVVFNNNTSNAITKWNANIFIPDSVLYTNYNSQSEIIENNGNYTLNEVNRYYGTNLIPAGGSYSVDFTVLTMQSVEDFSVGYGITGTDDNGNSVSDSNSIIQTVYGGNNQGGTTKTTNVTINGGSVHDVYGGGDQAVSNVTNVNINGKVEQKVFGGGNQAGINTNTNVNLIGATVGDNVYGGGDEGTVTGDTYVHVKNSSLNNSLYAGGNGSTAIVYGNTNLTMEGTTNNVTNNVFGGGNKAATGEEAKNTSKSTVNIVGGTIGKNVYGGANTSVVYGTTATNIGYDTVGDTSLEIGNVEIGGTVFGGGEANESGSENYDFSFISVTKGIDIQIDGNGHEKLSIKGSIFGSGNASSTSGESYINIQNYGTPDNPQSNISIQRANCATISNSAISLSGTTDRTNEYSTTFFALSRVDQVKLKNNSILYLCNGANLLKELDSLVDNNGTEEKAVVTINPDTGEVTAQNVDNRIYMLEGKNLNIATNEQVTAYGKVQGMFFFGLFTNRNNPSTSTGFYHYDYKNGDTITNEGTFSSNSYAMAEHMENHDTTIDGFYTNYKEEGKIKVNYIETTPKDDVYYIWLVGEKMDVTRFEMSLTASKYATLGTYELLLQGFSDPNIKFSITGFSAGLANGVSLVDPSEIETIAPDEDTANNVYGLSMKTGNTGWKNKGATTFLTKNGGTYTGTNDYDADNSTYTPTLNFCFYHSENLSKAQALGDVIIRLQVLTPIDDLNYNLSYIDIAITLSSALYQNDFYEAAITPGQEFGLFTTTETTITSKSAFSAYYSLYVEDFSESKYYTDYKTYQRVLVSRDANNSPYVFPENTKLTMLDMVTNKYYYYIVTAEDVAVNKYIYNLSDFIAMGSNDNKFNEAEACDNYYNTDQNLIYENFIFHVNFADSTLQNDIQNNSLLMELRDSENQTLVGVLGIQRDIMKYTVYNNKDATIKVEGTVEPETLYLGNTANLNVITNFTQTVVNSKTVYDTQYFDKKLGIKISIYDSNGNKLNNDSLLGVNFELDGQLYYPRVDGTTRINIAEKVTDVLAKIKINTQGNTTLATGDYKIRIESFGSSDGIYYGLTASDMIELDIRIINLEYGLKVTTADTSKIIEKDTGKGQNGSNSIVCVVEYSSALTNPNIAVCLYRRDYNEIFEQTYTLVDLKDYTTSQLTPTKREKEYVVSESPIQKITDFYTLKSNLQTGTYKLVYKLYDGDTYVGEAYDYVVIK